MADDAGKASAGGQERRKEATPEGPAARAGTSCGGKATAECSDARADPLSQGRKDDGALNGFRQLRCKAKGEGGAGAPEGAHEEEQEMEERRQKGLCKERLQQTRLRAVDRQRAEGLRAERQCRAADKREARTRRAAEQRSDGWRRSGGRMQRLRFQIVGRKRRCFAEWRGGDCDLRVK